MNDYDDTRPSEEPLKLLCRQCGSYTFMTLHAIEMLRFVPPCQNCRSYHWIDELEMPVTWGKLKLQGGDR